MSKERLIFLKDTFSEFELQFADDYSNAVIVNPNWNENITVYDDEYEFRVCFSFQHRHFEDKEDVVEWICKVIESRILAIEFFNKGQRRFGSDIETAELQDLSYEKLEQFTGYYGLTKLRDVADSFKIRGWDSFKNFDYTITCEANGAIIINKTFVGIMRKEIEINGCVAIPCEISIDEFTDAFIEWIESKGWCFGGGFNEIVDGYYINPDGTKGKSVLED